jgi:hypothetical protein
MRADAIDALNSIGITNVTDTNWVPVGCGDFNADGKVGLLWRHGMTGDVAVWFMNGLTYLSSVLLPRVADLDWTVGGCGDFNGDGKPDILWSNKTTGANTVWIMNNQSYVLVDSAS